MGFGLAVFLGIALFATAGVATPGAPAGALGDPTAVRVERAADAKPLFPAAAAAAASDSKTKPSSSSSVSAAGTDPNAPPAPEAEEALLQQCQAFVSKKTLEKENKRKTAYQYGDGTESLWSREASKNRHWGFGVSRASDGAESSGEGGGTTAAEEGGGETFVAWATLLLLSLEALAFLSAYVLKQTKFIYLQEAGAVILFSAVIGGFVRLISSAELLRSVLTFDAEFFMLFLLPPIIFESGYTMQTRRFFKNIDSVLAYAFLGTTIATFATGGMIYSFIMAFGLPHELTLLECLLFGALISATDPVTVLAIFKELKVDYDLYSNVFGESVLNDAIAIVLFRTLLGFVTEDFTAASLMAGVGMFLLIFVGSTLIGAAVALCAALLFKHTNFHHYSNLEVCLVTLFAYASYLIAEGLRLSGIVAILFCGIIMAHYMVPNLSKDAEHTAVHLFEIIALLSETLVFVYLGLSLFSIPSVEVPFLFLFCFVLFCAFICVCFFCSLFLFLCLLSSCSCFHFPSIICIGVDVPFFFVIFFNSTRRDSSSSRFSRFWSRGR
jgi:NhaP-type Na+/H+ or K+/H+ antiporter